MSGGLADSNGKALPEVASEGGSVPRTTGEIKRKLVGVSPSHASHELNNSGARGTGDFKDSGNDLMALSGRACVVGDELILQMR